MKVCSVLIADSNARLSQLVGQLLADEPGFQVLGVHTSAERALRVAQERRPDVVLVSERLEGRSVAGLCERLRERVPGAALLMWSHGPASRETGLTVADAVVERGVTFREFVRELRAIAEAHDHPQPADPAPRPALTWPDPGPAAARPESRAVLDDPESTAGLVLNCDSCRVQVRVPTEDVAPAVEEARQFFADHADCDTGIDLAARMVGSTRS